MQTHSKQNVAIGTAVDARRRMRPLSNRRSLVDFFGAFPENTDLNDLLIRTISNLRRSTQHALSENEAFAIGVLAYIYSFPAVEVGRTLHQLTAHGADQDAVTWNRLQVEPFGASLFHSACPDNDTVRAFAPLDLTHGPVLFSVPDAGDRYFSYQFIDAYSNVFASFSQASLERGRPMCAVVGPGWRGKLPDGLCWIQSLTRHNILIGRVFVGDSSEAGAAHDLFSRSTLAPLSAHEQDIDIQMDASPSRQATIELSGLRWFEFANRVLNEDPPTASDNDLIELFACLGFGPGFDLAAGKLSANARSGLERAIGVAYDEIVRRAETMGGFVNGWHITLLNRRIAETTYLDRAAIAYQRLMDGSAEEVYCADCANDAHGASLNSGYDHLLRFEKGDLPRAKAFWSLTSFPVSGRKGRRPRSRFYSNSSRRNTMRTGEDGSLTVLIKRDEPSDIDRTNWLPAPKGKFGLCLRIYGPSEGVRSETYQPPPVRRIA